MRFRRTSWALSDEPATVGTRRVPRRAEAALWLSSELLTSMPSPPTQAAQPPRPQTRRRRWPRSRRRRPSPTSPSNPVTGQNVHFDASASECDATPCTYTWADMPPSGGTWPLGSGQTLDFTFQEAATKYVTLTVTDAANQTATIEHDVAVATATTAAASNTALPAISGSTTQGQVLTTSDGTWNGGPTGYSYQWRTATAPATTAPTSPAPPQQLHADQR